MVKLICFEGIDASSKATQAELLATYLRNQGINVIKSEMPFYKSPTGEMIQMWLQKKWQVTMPEPYKTVYGSYGSDSSLGAHIFQALQTVDKFANLPNELWLGDEFMGIVIMDRYIASCLVYGKAQGINFEWLKQINKRLPIPDLSILLNISVKESFRRRPVREDKFENSRRLLESVRQEYLNYFNENSVDRRVIVDAEGDKNDVFRRVLNACMI